jgi:DNA-cytosine methyltransferase
MATKIKVLSLFDGISGAAQALKELDIDCEYYASEIDKYAIQIAKANHTDIIQMGDVKNVYGRECHLIDDSGIQNEQGTLIKVDLLIGGFPCQSFSIAGNQKGFADERGQLFFEVLRILEEVKPKYFIFENVKSMSKENKAIIDKKLGIGHVMINSALLTAQQRKRIYWVGKLVNGKYEQVKIEQPEDKGIVLKDILEKPDFFFGLYSDYNNSTTFDKSRTLGTGCGVTRNATCQQKITKNITIKKMSKGGQKDNVYSFDNSKNLLPVHDILEKLTPIECERLQGYPDSYSEGVSNYQRYKAIGNSFTVPVIKHILKEIKNGN